MKKETKEKGKAVVLTPEQFKRTLKFQKSTKYGLRNTLLLHISFYLGMRSKEMSSLIVGDLVDVNGDLKVECHLKKHQTIKSKQRRFYLTNDKLKKIVLEYLESRKNKDGALNLDEPLFLSQKGGSFNPNTLQQLFHKMYKSVGISGASSHSGRRTMATRCAESGVSIKNLQVLMGHSSISSTAIYIQESPTILGKIASEYKI
jgi:integrase/recombinase XerD